MSKSKVLPTHGAILRQIAITSTCFNMLKFHKQNTTSTKKQTLIQIGLYDSTKLLLSFVRLTFFPERTHGWIHAVGPFDQVSYRELEESSPQTWEKKDGLCPEDLLDESDGYEKVIKQTNCGGCLDTAHICFVFFLFYSTIMILH